MTADDAYNEQMYNYMAGSKPPKEPTSVEEGKKAVRPRGRYPRNSKGEALPPKRPLGRPGKPVKS